MPPPHFAMNYHFIGQCRANIGGNHTAPFPLEITDLVEATYDEVLSIKAWMDRGKKVYTFYTYRGDDYTPSFCGFAVQL